ncbi:hypothetical protein GCM10023194_47390 [Planotetraspora phitsanulokensis]|uniref:Uncharacterized protein n=1 Tax=Planotetraspora phitsanulokensis TaxID=575192 RepID=A0A8J3UGA3_9ACTN|nr:hypothetical protein Pph01_81700 [Planotetraspora phitsanulokensis]
MRRGELPGRFEALVDIVLQHREYQIGPPGDPVRVAVIQRMSWAFLRDTLTSDTSAWPTATSAFARLDAIGRLESK